MLRGVGGPAGSPAHDAPCIDVDDKSHIHNASPCRDIREVRNPQDVGRRRFELAIDAIQRARNGLVRDRRADRLAPNNALQSHVLHQPGDRAARYILALPLQLPPDLARPVDMEILLEHPANFALQRDIAPRPRRQFTRVGPLGRVIVIRRWGDRQHLADRLDPMRLALIVNKRDHRLNGRSSSAIAK